MPAAEITLPVTLAVLGAGFLHALWNAMLKSAAGEPLLDTALIVAGSSAVALVLLPFVAFPDRAAWPFMAVSAAIHFAYYITLAAPEGEFAAASAQFDRMLQTVRVR